MGGGRKKKSYFCTPYSFSFASNERFDNYRSQTGGGGMTWCTAAGERRAGIGGGQSNSDLYVHMLAVCVLEKGYGRVKA